ncbi:MAG TPA: hypothetical protein VFQ85_07065 [Mycobacteriales bacterium]|jgi:hypothetical protein|nr:hypothetical protein [Mycobacteriales bacterium]
MKRTLHLKRETLAELTSPELASVAGGTHVGCAATDGCTHGLSFDRCPTVPVTQCAVVVNSISPNCATIGDINTCIATA